MDKKSEGNLGENLACSYLTQKRYRIITRNFHSRLGEIDVIAQKNQRLFFIEVKTRSSDYFGEPQEAVGKRKLASIINTAHYFKLLNRKLPEAMQVDVIAIKLDSQGKLLNLKHFENVSL